MQYLTTNQLRQTFLDYFKSKGHQVVPSSSLVPERDPTLLFTNAGMVPFKDVFLGHQTLPYTKACSAQRCVRAGGKHNDLDNVGYTARHHTFFEMLGNFSFGDYFKEQAIRYAWEFLTETLNIPAEKLWVTVYETDTEAETIWLNTMQVDPERFSRCGADENFWSMGDTGPCGPCTEIFYDHGPELPGDPPGQGEEGDRFVEIWNLVFMEYDHREDGTLTDLPNPCVDTGMGLERIAAVMQGVHDNYHIDVFQVLMDEVAGLLGVDNHDQTSLRVVADHIRSTAFLIADGVMPTNEGRGYVLRRIIRRAIRHGKKLGATELFFYKLVPVLVSTMGEANPELSKSQTLIQKILKREESQFLTTLDQGLKRLEDTIQHLKGFTIPAENMFELYDTYGFPPDLTADIARERDLRVDYEGFEKIMQERRARSQAASGFTEDYAQKSQITEVSQFTGYESMKDQGTVLALIKNDAKSQHLDPGDSGGVILDRTPFYAEAGGQVGDTGYLKTMKAHFRVDDTQKVNQAYVHYGVVEKGQITVGDQVTAEVDPKRQAIMLNHSATHLLHAALRHVLGEHALQKGSLVEATRLRFDFIHFEPLTFEQMTEVERLVNQKIRENIQGEINYMTPEEAQAAGAVALFQQRYGEKLRVLRYGDFSMEPCGGTHVPYTGQIGFFKIIAQENVASGIRRLEAVTGEEAVKWVQNLDARVNEVCQLLRTDRDHFKEVVETMVQQLRQHEKMLSELKTKIVSLESKSLYDRVETISGIPVVAAELPEAEPKALRQAVDQLKQKFKEVVVVLATVKDDKVHLVAGVTKPLSDRIGAGDLVKHVAQLVGGQGGGRSDMAQGGGDQPQHLAQALSEVKTWIQRQIQG